MAKVLVIGAVGQIGTELTMVTAAHSKEDLNDALAVFEKVGKKLKVIS